MSTATLQATASTDEAEILALIDSMTEAVYRKDAPGFAAEFAGDAAICNLAPPLVHRGVDLAEKQAWFDSWATPIEIEARDFTVSASGDVAFAHGYMQMSGRKHGAEHGVNFWMRETLGLERKDGAWRIVHEHTSVPFYMDGSLRAAFDLEP